MLKTALSDQKAQSPEQEARSSDLSSKALAELVTTGKITVVCPKYKQVPQGRVDGNRASVRCSCGFIRNGEIYL